MLRIGITGQTGFIGKHLFNTLGLFPEEFIRVPFEKNFFSNQLLLERFVTQCDVIIHLAGINRHAVPSVIYETNVDLAQKLINALETTQSNPHVIYSSSIQEENDSEYGNSKKIARELFYNWSIKNKSKFSGLIIPNVFGPFGQPNYNSVISTFCYQLTHNQEPNIAVDNELKLIYIGELVIEILTEIRNSKSEVEIRVPFTELVCVSEILSILKKFKSEYFENGIIPYINSTFALNLFNTFRSYIDIQTHFPVSLIQHKDARGSFVEIIRLGAGGQISFSTTVPSVTRGNHFHTRKIERFSVIRGQALIQLRQIGTHEIYDFYLNGDLPSYVDIPVWYTHNIKNIGDELLYTNFWINEFYDPNDPDTYIENV